MSAFTNDYSAILNDLNRDVLRQRPTDILQFCADWFQTRLRDHRRVLSQGQDAATTTPTSTSSASRLQNVNPFGAVSASSSASVTSPFSGTSPSAAPPASLAAPAVVTSNTHQQQQRDSISSSSTSSDPDAFIPPPTFNLGRRESVSAESLAPSLGPSSHDADGKLLPKTVIPKTDSQKARIKASIGSNLLFRQLDEQQSNDVLLAMKEVKVDKDHIVIRQGDQGDFFYVVESGTLDVHIDPKLSSSFNNSIPRGGLAGRGSVGSTTSSDSTLGEDLGHHPPTTQGGSSIPHGQTAVSFLGEYKSSYGPSSAFGELALLYLQPRAASIVSTSPCVLWAVDRVTFRSILTETNGRKRWTLEKFLRKVSLFDTLDSSRIAKLADALHIREYKVGDRIITQGEPGREFFIVLSGELMVQRRRAEGEEEVQVGHVIAGEYFGGE